MLWLSTWLFTKTPLVWFVESYWRDEAFSNLLARQPWLQIAHITALDFSPPLYYYLLKLWMLLFGSSEIATRSFSLLCFVLTLFVMVECLVFIFRFRSRDISPVLIPLGLLTPVLAYYAFEARGYTLLALCATTSIYALCTKSSRLYALTILVGCLTHYSMIFVVITHATLVLLQQTPFKLKEYVRMCTLPWMIILAWMIYASAAHQGAPPASFWIPQPQLTDLLNTPEILLTGREVSPTSVEYVRSLTSLVYIVIAGALLHHARERRNSITILTASVLLPPVLIFFISYISLISLFHPRYMIVSTTPLLILLLASIKSYRSLHRIMLVCWLALFLYSSLTHRIKHRHKDDLRSVIYSIQLYSSPRDYLYVTSVLDYHPAQIYWYDKDRVKILGEEYRNIPSYVGKSLIDQSALDTSSTDCKDPCQIFVLDQSRRLKVMPKLL